jgi:Zn-dependent protease with chaperone function
MDLAVYLPLLLPLCAAAGAWPLATRLPPMVATWLLTSAVVALAALSTAALGLLAFTAVLRIPLVASLGHMSAAVFRREDPASLSAALVAAVLLAVAVLAAARTGWRRARALVSAAQEARCLPGSGQVVVIPDSSADAYAVPGWPGRIVVTAGMLDALAPAEQQVLLAHERAHAAGHHYLFIALSHLGAAANPLLRPVAAAVSYTVERWADEAAAGRCGDRQLAARAVGRAALASSRTGAPRGRAPATSTGIGGPVLSPVRRLTLRPGPVPRRVAALLAPAPSVRPLLVAAATAVVLVSGMAALDAAYELHALVELAQAPALLTPS